MKPKYNRLIFFKETQIETENCITYSNIIYSAYKNILWLDKIISKASKQHGVQLSCIHSDGEELLLAYQPEGALTPKLLVIELKQFNP